MATLAAVEKQIAQLLKQKEALLKSEAKEAIRTARALIEQFGLTAADLGLGKRAGKAGTNAAKGPAKPAKYRDPASGKTWNGHGKPPAWIAGVADRTPFLIDAPAAATEAAPKKAPKAAAKSAGKAPAKKKAAATGAKKKAAKATDATAAADGAATPAA